MPTWAQQGFIGKVIVYKSTIVTVQQQQQQKPVTDPSVAHAMHDLTSLRRTAQVIWLVVFAGYRRCNSSVGSQA
jgi:hypothetical protein